MRAMRILITTSGSHGDLNPFVAVGRALVERGHEVVILSNGYFRDLVEEAGLRFAPLGETFDLRDLSKTPDVMHARKGPRIVIEQFLMPQIEALWEAVPRVAAEFRPDLVLTHHILMGTPWICERIGVPWASAVLAPMLWMTPGDYLTPMPWVPLRRREWIVWLQGMLVAPAMRFQFDRGLNALRGRLGLAPARDVFLTITRGGVANLGLWSPVMRPAMPGDPPTGVVCGFPWHDRHGAQEDAPAEIERFLDAGEPPIIFSLGTAAVHVAGRFYHDAAEACRLLGRRGMLLVGRSGVDVGPLPPGVATFGYAPFSAVLGRGAATVHHGGIGSTGQALRAGRPQVIVPHAHDQFDNAARVERLGVSRTVFRTKLGARRLSEALGQVLDDGGVGRKAVELGRVVAGEDGGRRGAEVLEGWGAGRSLGREPEGAMVPPRD